MHPGVLAARRLSGTRDTYGRPDARRHSVASAPGVRTAGPISTDEESRHDRADPAGRTQLLFRARL